MVTFSFYKYRHIFDPFMEGGQVVNSDLVTGDDLFKLSPDFLSPGFGQLVADVLPAKSLIYRMLLNKCNIVAIIFLKNIVENLDYE